MEKYDRCSLIRNCDNIVTAEFNNVVHAFVNNQIFVANTIVGPTTIKQMRDNIQSFELKLSAAVMAAIGAIRRKYPNPCP